MPPSTRDAFLRVIVGVLIAISMTACSRSKEWTDEALLHDGRTIEVERRVYFHFGGGDLSQALTRWPDQYSLVAKNPDTRETVHWSGDRHFNPILLDFWNRSAYLVVVATSTRSDLAKYGCPEIPYLFFRHDEHSHEWRQLSAKEFPPALLRANLLFHYFPDATRLSKEQIDRDNRSGEFSSLGFMSRTIPTDFPSWTSRHKNRYRVGHRFDGCRHTVPSNEDPSHPQSPGHEAQQTELEILETNFYEQERIFSEQEWKALSWDQQRSDRCMSFVRYVGDDSDRPELRGWLLFANDLTGSKKARNLGPILCDDSALWFVEYGTERRYIVLTKFAISGEFIYRAKFARPQDYPGHILQSTFRPEDGYLYFEWWDSWQSGSGRRAKMSMKVRVREP